MKPGETNRDAGGEAASLETAAGSVILCGPDRPRPEVKSSSAEGCAVSRSEFLQPRFYLVTGLVLLAAASRLMELPWNVAPIGAMALFGGASFASRKTAMIVPMLAMLLSDLILYTGRDSHWLADSWKFVPFTYLSFAAIAALGFRLRTHRTAKRIVLTSLAGSVLFFVVSNFASWAIFTDYTRDLSGLVNCYVQAIPFFRNTLLSDLGFNAVLFGCLALAESRLPAVRLVPVPAEAV